MINVRPETVATKPGVPAIARDRANRVLLKKRLAELEERESSIGPWEDVGPLLRRIKGALAAPVTESPLVRMLFPGANDLVGDLITRVFGFDGMTLHERELAGARVLSDQLTALERRISDEFPGSRAYLLDVETGFANGDGRAVISIGDPYSAGFVGTVVPGINNVLAGIEGPIEKAANIQQGVAEVIGSSEAAELSAVVTWLGYDTPDGVLDALTANEAHLGSQTLKEWLEELKGARAPDESPSYAVFGHSFGSTVTGLAACSGLAVNHVVLLGSPGAGCHSSDDLRRGANRVWAATSSTDLFIMAAAVLAPLGGNPVVGFGSEPLPMGDGLQQAGHGQYFEQGSWGLENLVRIQLDRPGDIR